MTEQVKTSTETPPSRREIARFAESVNATEVLECEGCHRLHQHGTLCDCGAHSSLIHPVCGSYWVMSDEDGEPIHVDIDGCGGNQ